MDSNAGVFMTMREKKQNKPAAVIGVQEKLYAAVEEILEKKLDDLATVLSVSDNGNSLLREKAGH